MQRFGFERARIDRAVREIERLRRLGDAADDAAVRSAFDYEISEQEKLARLLLAQIARETHREGEPLQRSSAAAGYPMRS